MDTSHFPPLPDLVRLDGLYNAYSRAARTVIGDGPFRLTDDGRSQPYQMAPWGSLMRTFTHLPTQCTVDGLARNLASNAIVRKVFEKYNTFPFKVYRHVTGGSYILPLTEGTLEKALMDAVVPMCIDAAICLNTRIDALFVENSELFNQSGPDWPVKDMLHEAGTFMEGIDPSSVLFMDMLFGMAARSQAYGPASASVLVYVNAEGQVRGRYASHFTESMLHHASKDFYTEIASVRNQIIQYDGCLTAAALIAESDEDKRHLEWLREARDGVNRTINDIEVKWAGVKNSVVSNIQKASSEWVGVRDKMYHAVVPMLNAIVIDALFNEIVDGSSELSSKFKSIIDYVGAHRFDDIAIIVSPSE